MPDEVLSQSEIDALLSALSTGEMNADDIKKEEELKKVKVYDFKRALRFSKDQIRNLTRLHENFARLLTSFFSAQLRTYVQITVASADQLPYEEFIRSIPKMTVLNVMDISPLDGRILMEINPNIAYTMMDRVMGGRGESINKVENLTEIEKTIMSSLFERAFENLQEAWSSVIDITPSLAEFEVNPQFLQMVSPNETVVVISLNTTIGETSGMINMCIPQNVIDPIVPKLSVHYWMQNNNKKETDINSSRQLERRLINAFVPIIAELGYSEITIEDFLSLEIGDVIELDNRVEDLIKVKVDHTPKFLAQPGKQAKKMAIQIFSTIEEGDEEE